VKSVNPGLEIAMLFNKWVETVVRYDYSGETELRPTNDPVSLNQSVHALRQQQVGKPARSVIDAWLTITGNLESEGDIQIDGKVQGQIRCSQIIVGKDAMIDGDIVAAEVVVRGKVKGVIRANRVKLQETACVESDIFFDKTLGIEDGAFFQGQIRRAPEPSLARVVPIDCPRAAADETDEIGLAATLSLSNPGEIDTRVGSKSQPRRDRQGRAHVRNPE
jgi:cytoskeletal protein CcmA (bactofilin family)